MLYAFGNDNLKGFSISLTVGLIISLFTALYVTRLIFDYALANRYIRELRMMKLFARPSFDFMAIRKAMFALTATLTVLGTSLFLYRGDTILNVDFTKGTVYGGRMAPGEERALNDTDKRGLLSLVSETAQRERLASAGGYVAQARSRSRGRNPSAPQRRRRLRLRDHLRRRREGRSDPSQRPRG